MRCWQDLDGVHSSNSTPGKPPRTPAGERVKSRVTGRVAGQGGGVQTASVRDCLSQSQEAVGGGAEGWRVGVRAAGKVAERQ